MKNRNHAIDILKGIGIILVLAAHSIEGWLSQFAYTFHMPLFFIVTGLFIKVYNSNDEISFGKWWQRAMVKDFERLQENVVSCFSHFAINSVCIFFVIYYQ